MFNPDLFLTQLQKALPHARVKNRAMTTEDRAAESAAIKKTLRPYKVSLGSGLLGHQKIKK